MVVFTCQHCGASVKKNAVEKHYMQQCRNRPLLTCIDCLKDFRDNEYDAHKLCISEAERYGGKNFVPKAKTVKQNAWVESVQKVLENKQLGNQERCLLETISTYQNVPMIKKKFENFTKNIGKHFALNVIDSVFNLISTSFNEMKQQNSSNKETNVQHFDEQNNKRKRGENVECYNEQVLEGECKEKADDSGWEVKLNKKKQKKDQKEGFKSDLKEAVHEKVEVDVIATIIDENEFRQEKGYKKHKKKHRHEENMITEENEVTEELGKFFYKSDKHSKKNKKLKHFLKENCEKEEEDKRNLVGQITKKSKELYHNEYSINTFGSPTCAINEKNGEGIITIGNNKELSDVLETEEDVVSSDVAMNGQTGELNGCKFTDEQLCTKNNIVLSKKEKKKKLKKEKFEAELVKLKNHTKERTIEEDVDDEKKRKKKKKTSNITEHDEAKRGTKTGCGKDVEAGVCTEEFQNVLEEMEIANINGLDVKSGPSKFNWEEVIVKVLRSTADKEMSLKRLSKKIVTEYEFQMGPREDCDTVTAKFNKKIRKINGVRVLKDRAKLIAT